MPRGARTSRNSATKWAAPCCRLQAGITIMTFVENTFSRGDRKELLADADRQPF
jgi:hypothetical protein